MAQKRGISPWMLILPVACLIGGVAAVYWSAPWRQPEPAAIPKATPIAQLGEGASAPAPLALPPVAPRAADRGDPHAQLAGLVIDGDLAPVSNVPLCVFGPTGIADATAISSTTGAYRFDSLLPGPCRLVVEATGYARTGLAGLNLLAGATLSDATVLLLPEAPIRGQVRANLSGEPLSGARITATLYAIDQKLIPLVAEFHQSITAIADASGYFVLAGLWPRVHYDLVAEASGFVRGRKTQVGSGTAGVDFVLSRGGAISGVALQAETGQPAPRAIISAHRLERSSYAVTADADGRFFLSGLPRGEYRLDAVWGDSFMLPHPDLERLQVEVGREVTGVTVELQKGGSLAGRVLDRRKESPVSGAVLELTSAWGRTQVESDAAGRFRFPALREGAYQLAVAAPAYAATRALSASPAGRRCSAISTCPAATPSPDSSGPGPAARSRERGCNMDGRASMTRARR
ncbi:carboxypeptidase regulatory-like domain-containing protein [bacterium]|nr:carboxypeptidase regulatory-like domain-containing protein [bacterium]